MLVARSFLSDMVIDLRLELGLAVCVVVSTVVDGRHCFLVELGKAQQLVRRLLIVVS